jgi:cytochrome c7-like protein
VLACLAALALPPAGRAGAQPLTQCESCHAASVGDVPAPDWLVEWRQSSHAAHRIGCHECHGGDPSSPVQDVAHRGMLAAMHPRSPVHAANLAQTCARCHKPISQAFSISLHQTLVQAGDRRAPTCATCHGPMSATVPSPAALEARCAGCHPASSPRSAYPALMRDGIDAVHALRARADALDAVVARMTAGEHRVELLGALYDARTTLNGLAALVHVFDVQQMPARIAAARAELDALAQRVSASAAR